MAVTSVRIHASQYPAAVREALLSSLRARRLNHTFLYLSYRQASLWMALHEGYSPAARAEGGAPYEQLFAAAAAQSRDQPSHLIALGCGGGAKEAKALEHFSRLGGTLRYTPSDVSLPLVLHACESARRLWPSLSIDPLVCDLAGAEDPTKDLRGDDSDAVPRCVTFFGMLPNFEPGQIVSRLRAVLRMGDLLLLSANLAPGDDYAGGVERVLPQYDNPPTRRWLTTFWQDLGIRPAQLDMTFSVEEVPGTVPLRRIRADVCIRDAVTLQVEGETLSYEAGAQVRTFFSYRHTPELVRRLLATADIVVEECWTDRTGEEGVFLCRKA